MLIGKRFENIIFWIAVILAFVFAVYLLINSNLFNPQSPEGAIKVQAMYSSIKIWKTTEEEKVDYIIKYCPFKIGSDSYVTVR
ncbi:hypothetical protein [Fuchsiella alkaliacetigena]|uniref:hypothetical protein n=1 Tax=Fuchsiella alkaliacetigena TaxID=957042 RepID=UPI00200B937B|nr:hypothetical protein [Fuchsiella alkaliacetigena]